MATKTLKFKRLKFINPYSRYRKRIERAVRDFPEKEAKFIRVRARSIMKKAPQKGKTRYGNYQTYTQKTYVKRQARHRAKNKKGSPSIGFWRKGLYSRPGHPPFYHQKGAFNLRTIAYKQIQNPEIRHARGGHVNAWIVGPLYKRSRHSIPVPQLHEHGGVIRLNKQGSTFKTKNPNIRLRRLSSERAVYPKRPYMAPSAKEARESAARKSPNSLRNLVRLGGMVGGRRIY